MTGFSSGPSAKRSMSQENAVEISDLAEAPSGKGLQIDIRKRCIIPYFVQQKKNNFYNALASRFHCVRHFGCIFDFYHFSFRHGFGTFRKNMRERYQLAELSVN